MFIAIAVEADPKCTLYRTASIQGGRKQGPVLEDEEKDG